MTILALGVVLWTLIHLFPVYAPNQRASLVNYIGLIPYKGLFSIPVLASLGLISWGWQQHDPAYVYELPFWARHLAMLMIFFAVVLFGTAMGKSRIRQFIRNPMLAGVVVWATAHLLVNGDENSLILFGGLLLWAVISIIGTNRREGGWQKPEIGSWLAEIRLLVIAVAVCAGLIFAHPYLSGMPLF
ncbi:NnrU protein [Candidatus Terasakiella magnetica]|uniref:NnrU protein n=1 Tax=Candidatus Terasakiella magnetica TaxID=1867952 RepID=A0A1C3RGV2_9PROT|nr:NnrU family protein [Candidatus Terasakiella magnetica]SCA56536.1 NnrU protein [Candidatus Terasakiella magnetica]